MTKNATWQRSYDADGEPQGRGLLSQCEALWRWKRDEKMQFVPLLLVFFKVVRERRLDGTQANILVELIARWRHFGAPFEIDTAELATYLCLTRRNIQRTLSDMATKGAIGLSTFASHKKAVVDLQPFRLAQWRPETLTDEDLPPIEGPIARLGYKTLWFGDLDHNPLAFTAVPENLLPVVAWIRPPSVKLVLLVAAVIHGPASTEKDRARIPMMQCAIRALSGLKKSQTANALRVLVQTGFLHRDRLKCDCGVDRGRGGHHFSPEAFYGISNPDRWDEVVKRAMSRSVLPPLAEDNHHEVRWTCPCCAHVFSRTLENVQLGERLKDRRAALVTELKAAHDCTKSDVPRGT